MEFNWKYLKWPYRIIMLFGFGCAFYCLSTFKNDPDYAIIVFGVVTAPIFTIIRWIEKDRHAASSAS